MSPKSMSFAKWMYKESKVVVVKPLAETAVDLELLDILIKETTESGHPVLEKVESMLEIGRSGAPYETTAKELKDNLILFRENKGCKHFRTNDDTATIGETFGSASCLAGSILSGVADAQLNLFAKGKRVAVSLESCETEDVNRIYLEKIIRTGAWKPDTENNCLKKWPHRCLWFPGTQTKGRKMWLVYQLLKASKLRVYSVDSSSHGGTLAISAILPPIMGPTPGAGLQVYRVTDGSLEVVAKEGKKILVGFRALSFRYDAEGNLIQRDFKRHAGHRRPIARDNEEEDNVRPHLRGLFLEKPPKAEVEEEVEDEDEDEDEDEGEEEGEEEDEEEDDDEDEKDGEEKDKEDEDEGWEVVPLDFRAFAPESS